MKHFLSISLLGACGFLLSACGPAQDLSNKAQTKTQEVTDELQAKYNVIQLKIKETQDKIAKKKAEAEAKAAEIKQLVEESKTAAEAKIVEIEQQIADAKKAYEEAKAALNTLNEAAQSLKSTLATPEL